MKAALSRPSVALLLALAAASCSSFYPARLPGPLPVPEAEGSPAEPAPTPSSGAITLQRDSDPVWIRRPGERGDMAVPFYDKRQRVPYGAIVRTGPSGRAECLWLPDASALLLFDEGRVTVGDPERDEPLVRFHSVSHALLTLTPEDEVELLGGARLIGDPHEASTGPVLLERRGSIQRVTNQSKRLVGIEFRSARLELAPSESIDLPVLPGAPRSEPSERLQGAGITAVFEGELERREAGETLELAARAPAEVRALGVALHLAPGEVARFSNLPQVAPVGTSDASDRP